MTVAVTTRVQMMVVRMTLDNGLDVSFRRGSTVGSDGGRGANELRHPDGLLCPVDLADDIAVGDELRALVAGLWLNGLNNGGRGSCRLGLGLGLR